MQGIIEIECKDPENIIKALLPDVEEGGKFNIKLNKGKGKLLIEVESEELSGLNAGISSYMRLVRAISTIRD